MTKKLGQYYERFLCTCMCMPTHTQMHANTQLYNSTLFGVLRDIEIYCGMLPHGKDGGRQAMD
jgi:hypothetical protein